MLVIVFVNVLFDINVMGTYGAAADVSYLAERLGDLLFSLGVEFGFIEDLLLVVNVFVVGGGYLCV